MDLQATQTRLESLYADWKATLRFSKEEADSLGPPLLLHVSEEYIRAERRVLLLGRETNGWEWDSNLQVSYPAYPHAWTFHDTYSCSDFLTNPDSIEALCWGYREFKFGAHLPALSRTPFWQAFKEVCAWPGVGMMWSNVARMDYDGGDQGRSIWNAPESLRDTLISQQTTLFTEELALLKHHVCLFFSGPYYDDFIKAMLPNCEVIACGDAAAWELARLVHGVLPAASFRTYHPRFLSQGDRWPYIEAMRGLSYNG